MKFGIFYEHQLPQPWGEDSELRLYQQALDQIELADRLGIDYVWEVEHHFLEEYSHSSAPEVFLAACSQRTKQIRLGHGITLMPPSYNHPARVAERIATLDLVERLLIKPQLRFLAPGLRQLVLVEQSELHLSPPRNALRPAIPHLPRCARPALPQCGRGAAILN